MAPFFPDLPSLTPPFLYFLVSLSLFHHFLLPPPPSSTTSPSYRIFPFILSVFSLSLFLISLFHINSQSSLNTLPNNLLRQQSLPNHLFRQQSPPPTNPQLPSPALTAPSPSPSFSATPTPSPIPSSASTQPPPPVTNPPASTSSEQPTTNQADNDVTRTTPTLDECSGGLLRMQVLLLLEFFAEWAFLLMRCLSSNDEYEPTCDISFRVFTLMRAVYTVPVIALNASILFIGGGPTGSCLPAHPAVQVAFIHLILYALFSIAFVIFGLYRLGGHNSEKDSYTPSNYNGYSQNGSYPYPPSRTESYFHPRSRSRRDFSYDYSDEGCCPPINCGCCRMVF